VNLTIEAYILSDLPCHCILLHSVAAVLIYAGPPQVPIDLHCFLLSSFTIAMPLFNILLHFVGVVLVLLAAACTYSLHFVHATYFYSLCIGAYLLNFIRAVFR